jgi:hypothetical protein
MPRPDRLLYLSLLVFILVRSVLESGLLDATPAFCVFFAISLVSEERSRRASRVRPGPLQAAVVVPSHVRAVGALPDRPLSLVR